MTWSAAWAGLGSLAPLVLGALAFLWHRASRRADARHRAEEAESYARTRRAIDEAIRDPETDPAAARDALARRVRGPAGRPDHRRR